MNSIHTAHKEPTFLDMVRKLLEQPYNLVLVQAHELERIKKKGKRNKNDVIYITTLFKHYIVNKKPKMYLKE